MSSTRDPRQSCLSSEEALQGATLWALLANPQSWVHRRVESIRILDDRTARRRVSVDLTVRPEDLPGRSPERALPALPLTFLKKEVLKRFNLTDQSGQALPMLTRKQNGQAVGNALVQTVETWVQNRLGSIDALPSRMVAEVRAIVERDPDEAAAALARWHEKGEAGSGDPDQRSWQAVVENEALLTAAAALTQNFVLLAVSSPRPGERQLFKYEYDEGLALTSRQLWLTSTGWVAERLTFEAPAVALSASYHFELLAVEDLEIVQAEMGFRPIDGQIPTAPPPDGKPRGPLTSDVHFSVAGVDRAYEGAVRIDLRAAARGFVRGASLTGAFVLLSLGGGAFHLKSISASGADQVAAALLLLAPAVFGAVIIRPGEHRLASRMLFGVRSLLVVNMGAAVFAVGLLASGYKDNKLLILWLLAVFIAAVTTAGVMRPLLVAPRVGSSRKRTRDRGLFIEHVTLVVSDVTASERFYGAALAPFGAFAHQVGRQTVFGPPRSHDFTLVAGSVPSTPIRVTFLADSRAQVRAFHTAALSAEGVEHQAPAARFDQYPGGYCASVLDPDRNIVEALVRED